MQPIKEDSLGQALYYPEGDFVSVHALLKCFTNLDLVLVSLHGTTRIRFSPILSLEISYCRNNFFRCTVSPTGIGFTLPLSGLIGSFPPIS